MLALANFQSAFRHRPGDTTSRSPRRRVTKAARIVGLALAGCTVLSLLEASTAHALGISPVPISPVTVAVPIAKAIVSAPLKAAVSALLGVLEAIFGGIEAKLITGVINGLLAVPNFDTGHIAALEHTTNLIAVGMLSAVLTLSILRYYLAGLTDSGSGGFEAIQGLIRVIGAVGFIVAWPGIYSELLQIPKMFNGALLGSGDVQKSVADLFDAALVVGTGVFSLSSGLGLIFVVLMGFLAALVFIALLWMKVLLSVMLMFLYVAMPLCVVLWPVPELSWLASSAMRSLFVGLLVPCVWAILFALSSAVNADVLSWAPSHSIIDTVIIRPLAGITLMLLCITVPRFLMRTAMIGPHGEGRGGGWRIWRTVTFGMFAMRGAAGAAQTVAKAATEGQPTAQRMIDALPAQVKPPSGPGEGTLAGRIVFGRSGFGEPSRGSSPASGAPAAPGTGAQSGDAASEPTAAGSAIRRQEAGFSVPGIERPAYDRAAIDQAWQSMQASSKLSPPSAAAVSSAMGEFPAATQRALAAFHQANPSRVRQWSAQHVGAAGLSEGQRAALLTIGSAPTGALQQGMGSAIGRLDAQERAQSQESTRWSAPTAPPTPPQDNATADAPTARSSKPTAPGSGLPSQPGAPGGPAGGAPSPPPSGPPVEVDGGGQSLGANVPEQPRVAPSPPRPQAPADGSSESEPFLD